MAHAASFPISAGAISGPPFSMPTESWFVCADGGLDKANVHLCKYKGRMWFIGIVLGYLLTHLLVFTHQFLS